MGERASEVEIRGDAGFGDEVFGGVRDRAGKSPIIKVEVYYSRSRRAEEEGGGKKRRRER